MIVLLVEESRNRGPEMLDQEFKDKVFDYFSTIAAAFSSPKRVEIVDLLAQAERSVDSIAEITGISVANTSRHLQVLRSAGLLTARRDGNHVRYRVADPAVADCYLAIRVLAENRIAEVRQVSGAFFGAVDGVEPISIADLASGKAGDAFQLLDVRPRQGYETGHLPGAVHIPIEELADRVAELDDDSPVVVYGRGQYCILAARAAALLRENGLQARRLDGGPLEWKAVGLPLVSADLQAT